MSRARFVRNVKVSERHGAGEWLAERASSLILVPLGLWGVWSAYGLAGADYATAAVWFTRTPNAVLLAATHLLISWHMALGMTVIIDDYIHRPGSRNALVWASNIFCLVLAAAGVFLIVRLALASAPLPAGIGA